MKKEIVMKVCGTLSIVLMIIVVAIIGSLNTNKVEDDPIVKEEPLNLTEEEWQEVEDVTPTKEVTDIGNINEWYDDYEVVYYGETQVKRYADEKATFNI